MTRRSHALQSEYEIVRQCEAFQRAPVQSRLLNYLYEMAVGARTTALTQRDVALDGLGREESFDETTDSYVRVQVSRLRKTLRRYYATHDPVGQGCIYIAPGSYELKIGSLEVGYPKIARHLRTSSVQVPPQKAPEQNYDASANLSDTEPKKTRISRSLSNFQKPRLFCRERLRRRASSGAGSYNKYAASGRGFSFRFPADRESVTFICRRSGSDYGERERPAVGETTS